MVPDLPDAATCYELLARMSLIRRFEERADRADRAGCRFEPSIRGRVGVDRPAKRGAIARAGKESHE